MRLSTKRCISKCLSLFIINIIIFKSVEAKYTYKFWCTPMTVLHQLYARSLQITYMLNIVSFSP